MPIDYLDPDIYVFLTALAAFVLLTLIVMSVPMAESSSFLHLIQSNGVSFGMWGWCLDDGATSSPMQFGYTWPAEINTPITISSVLYLIAYVLTFFTTITLVLAMCRQSPRSDIIFSIFAWSAFFVSAIASLFTIAIYSTAKSIFEKNGFVANYGILIWISPLVTTLLFIVSLRAYYLQMPRKQQSCLKAAVRDVES